MYIKKNDELVQKIELDNETIYLSVDHFDYSEIDFYEVARLANERLINFIVNKQQTEIPFETMESFIRIELLRKLREFIK